MIVTRFIIFGAARDAEEEKVGEKMGSKLVEHGEAKGKSLVLPRDVDNAWPDKEIGIETKEDGTKGREK